MPVIATCLSALLGEPYDIVNHSTTSLPQTSFASTGLPIARGSAGKQLLQRQLNSASLYLQQAMHGAAGLKEQIADLSADVRGLSDYTGKAKEQVEEL